MRIALALLVALASAPAPAAAQSAAELLREGHRAYREDRYPEAADRYQRAIRAGAVSADVHYDLGNAYYKLGRNGQAALAYERALRLDPRHEDAQANLHVVQRRTGYEKAVQELGIPREGIWVRLARSVTANETAVALLVVWLLFFVVLFVRHFRPPGSARSLLGLAGLVLFVLALAAGGFFGYRVYRAERVTEGVILEPKVALMEPQGGAWKAVRSLPEGLRVRILARNESWVQVRLPGGLSGFVRDAQVGQL